MDSITRSIYPVSGASERQQHVGPDHHRHPGRDCRSCYHNLLRRQEEAQPNQIRRGEGHSQQGRDSEAERPSGRVRHGPTPPPTDTNSFRAEQSQ